MKNLYQYLILCLIFLTIGIIMFVNCSGVLEPKAENSLEGFTQTPAVKSLLKRNLDDIEKADLLYMREEEKLARDVYITLFEAYGLNIFSKIITSEQNHMDALKRLLDKHNMEDPVTDEDVLDEFVNEKIQALYEQCLEMGLDGTSIDALTVGALIEEIDIEDLLHFLERVDNQDIIKVYNNILEGSYNHLRAFVSGLEDLGVVYEPVILDQELYDKIIAGDMLTRSKGKG